MAPQMDRKDLFYCWDTALWQKVALGDPTFNRNLDQLRLDVFGNTILSYRVSAWKCMTWAFV